MIWFKSCPRCHIGDLILERDVYGEYAECLSCGFVKDLDQETIRTLARGQERKTAKGMARSA